MPAPRSTAGEVPEPLAVPVPLELDVRLVPERGDRAGLHRAGDHQTGVPSHVEQVADQIGVAGEETRPDAREVRPLGEGVHRDHPVSPLDRTVRGGVVQVNSA